jgi:hypothetical protein
VLGIAQKIDAPAGREITPELLTTAQAAQLLGLSESFLFALIGKTTTLISTRHFTFNGLLERAVQAKTALPTAASPPACGTSSPPRGAGMLAPH